MPELLTIDGLDLRGQAFGCATRTGRYSMPAKRGENLVLPGASGSRFSKNKPYDEGVGALSVWAIGADTAEAVLATNLITNPSAEVDLTGWQGQGSPTRTRDTAQFKQGVASHKIVATTSFTGTFWSLTGLTIGSLYSFSAWIKGDVTAVGKTIRFTASGGGVTDKIVTLTNDWQEVIFTFNPAVTNPNVYIDTGTTSTGVTWWVDLATVVNGLSSPFDGATPDDASNDYRWTGTANASTSQRVALGVLSIPATFALQRQAFENNMAKIMRVFTRGHKLSTIRAAQPDASIRRALVEWKEWTEPEVMAGGTRAEWAIAYTIPGVWWEDESPTVQAATAGATLPKTLDLTSFTGMTGVIEDAVFTVTGPITNPRITDAETGAYVEFTGTVTTGQTWVLDVAAATSIANGTTVINTTKHTGGYKLFVIPNCFGTATTPRLTLSGTTGGAGTNLSVSARRKWVNG